VLEPPLSSDMSPGILAGFRNRFGNEQKERMGGIIPIPPVPGYATDSVKL